MNKPMCGELWLAKRGFADSEAHSSTQIGDLMDEYAKYYMDVWDEIIAKARLELLGSIPKHKERR